MRLPLDYRHEKIPVPGKTFTEGVGIGDSLPEGLAEAAEEAYIAAMSSTAHDVVRETERRDDVTFFVSALGVASLALGVAAYRLNKKRGK